MGDDATRCRPGVFARAWAKAVSGTSYLPMTQSQLEEILQRLTDRLAQAIRAEPFDLRIGQQVGAELVQAHIASAEGLGRTVEVIQLRLVRDLDLVVDDVEDRMARLLATVATGYARALRDRTLDEQEALRRAAMMPRALAERALRDSEARFRHQATHDPLTGLPNRTLFTERLTAAITAPGRGADRIGVCFLDLDRFKVVNDSLGHEAGDELLVQVARRLQQALRPGDVLGRLGGDEFTVLAENIAHDHAMALAERLREQLATPFELAGGEFLMSSSVGVATSSVPECPEDLMRWADAAMYRAKQGGRDCVVAFDDVLRNEALEQLETDQRLRVALDRDELRVVYQPEIRLATGAVVGAEALVRWDHPTRGTLGAGEFVPLAEENGTILAIDRWVLEVACTQLAEWTAGGVVDDDFVLRVNISARHLEQRDLVDRVRAQLEQSGVAPERLCLEITETALMRDVERALVVLTELNAVGVRLAVDDFGTGYSSLGSLKRFPLQVLKIDRSFIDGLPDDPDDTAIATTVLRLADALGLSTTAEGVESVAQLECLRELGCPTAQGYVFSEPLRPADFERFLAERA